MKFSVAVAAAVLPLLVVAQDIPGVPECAQPCLATAIEGSDCGADDQTCQCSESGRAAIQEAASRCVLENCTSDEVQQALAAAEEACSNLQPTVTDDQTASDTGSATTTETVPSATTTESTTISTDTDTDTATDTDTETSTDTDTATMTDTDTADTTSTTTTGGGGDSSTTTTGDGSDQTSTSQALGNAVPVGSTGGILAAIFGAFMIL